MVVAIIAVLASLLLAAIFKAMATAQMVQNRNDIIRLEAAIADFKQAFPGRLPAQHIQAGDPFYTKLFPEAGAIGRAALPHLQGSQCLIFFLGGVNGQGFSSNPHGPIESLRPRFRRATQRAIHQFPERSQQAVFQRASLSTCTRRPLAYFSTTGTPNSYLGTENQDIGCPAPYLTPAGTTYLNPDTFQIISAGPDDAVQPGQPLAGRDRRAGFDDISNFATGPLGTGQ